MKSIIWTLKYYYCYYLFVHLWFFNLGFPCVSLYAPGTHFVDKTGLRLTEIHLPLPPSAGIKDMHWTPFFFKKTEFVCVILPVLDLSLQNKVALNSQWPACLGLPDLWGVLSSLWISAWLSIYLLVYLFFFFCFVRQGFSLALESVLDSDLVTAVPEAVRPLAGNPQSLCPGPSRGTTLPLSPCHNQGCRLHLRQA